MKLGSKLAGVARTKAKLTARALPPNGAAARRLKRALLAGRT